jgi:acyl-CoA synthetase (AMP-forming)/AMP-acid ligase II
LRGLIWETTAGLNGLGIGRGDRVGRLAEFKVPRRIVFLAEIPQGPTGKLQRVGLAAKLGLVS